MLQLWNWPLGSVEPHLQNLCEVNIGKDYHVFFIKQKECMTIYKQIEFKKNINVGKILFPYPKIVGLEIDVFPKYSCESIC